MKKGIIPSVPSDIYKFQMRSGIRFVVKPTSVMHDYISLHWLVPKNEIKDFHYHIPPKQVWVRDTVWYSPKQNALRRHELYELMYMTEHGWDYHQAHELATIEDGAWQ